MLVLVDLPALKDSDASVTVLLQRGLRWDVHYRLIVDSDGEGAQFLRGCFSVVPLRGSA